MQRINCEELLNIIESYRVWVLVVLDTILVLDDTKVKQGINLLPYCSLLWCQGGSRLRETPYFNLSTTILIGCTLADWCLTLIEIKTMNSSQSFLSYAWNPTEPSKRIMAIISLESIIAIIKWVIYLAIRCHNHRRWNPAHHLFSSNPLSLNDCSSRYNTS
jgi:hypothetical protein